MSRIPFVLLLVSLVFPSCKNSDPDSGLLFIGSREFEKFVLRFIDDAKAENVDLSAYMNDPKLEIRVGQLDEYSRTTVGLCQLGKKVRVVIADTEFWANASEERKELMLWHEFGHCLLDRGHKSSKNGDGTYASVMHPYMMPTEVFLERFHYYREELFRRSERPREELPEEPVTYLCREDHLSIESPVITPTEEQPEPLQVLRSEPDRENS